jgi:hypothetical protein
MITERIQQMLPKDKLSDTQRLSEIVNDFIRITEIKGITWANSRDKVWCRLTDDEYRLCKVTDIREMLTGVILMFFHPEKVLGFTNSATTKGVLTQLAKTLNCDKVTLSYGIGNAVSYYKNYKSFKNEVDHLYNQIKISRGYFENIAGC